MASALDIRPPDRGFNTDGRRNGVTVLSGRDVVEIIRRSRTGAQVDGTFGLVTQRELTRRVGQRDSDYKVYRDMRLDSTIWMARGLSTLPFVDAGWSVEATSGAPDGAKDLIRNMFEPLRQRFVKTALEGCCDYGYAAFEKIFTVSDDHYITLKALKPLLQTLTDILVDPVTGEFEGFRQTSLYGAPQENTVERENALLINIDVEGTDWYGMPLMAVAREAYEAYLVAEEKASRYDAKMAGSFWRVGYPPGVTPVAWDENGNPTEHKDNFLIAKELVNTLAQSGAVAHPTQIAPYADSSTPNAPDAWQVELMSDKGNSSENFVGRERYLDARKVRAFFLPERSVLEGQFGTKAEAEKHADFAITALEVRYALVVAALNRGAVDQVLELNYGKGYDGTVYLMPTPLADQNKSFIREIYASLLQAPASDGRPEHAHVDTTQIRDQLGVPSIADDKLPPIPPPPPVPPAGGQQEDTGDQKSEEVTK